MKKDFPSIIIIILVIGYIASVASMLLDKAYLLYGLIGIGLYFSPLALISLIIYRFSTSNYDKQSLKTAIFLVLGSILITALTILFINNSFDVLV